MDYNFLGIFLLVINLFGFLTVGLDKAKAKRDRWRIPEKHFFIVSVLGGAVGVYLGMKLFRHKTKHKKFVYGIPILIVLNLVSIYYLTQIFSQ
jgi:uncharacterized membrane protein YsdA (DUF1294 family)